MSIGMLGVGLVVHNSMSVAHCMEMVVVVGMAAEFVFCPIPQLFDF